MSSETVMARQPMLTVEVCVCQEYLRLLLLMCQEYLRLLLLMCVDNMFSLGQPMLPLEVCVCRERTCSVSKREHVDCRRCRGEVLKNSAP
jgi:hypothetical protein